MKYKNIKSRDQYYSYCNKLEELLESSHQNQGIQEEIDLLTFLIEKRDEEHNSFDEVDPIRLLKSL